MGLWFELANLLSFGIAKIIKEAKETQKRFDSKILEYVNKINSDAEKDANNEICRNLSNSLYEFSKYVMENYEIRKSNDARFIKKGTFKWRVASILKELDSAWQENEKSLIKSDSSKSKNVKLIREEAQSYISKKRAYNALKFLTMKGNKRSYWNNNFCKKIKIPEEFISEEENNKK